MSFLSLLIILLYSTSSLANIRLISVESISDSHDTCLTIAKKLSSVSINDCQQNSFSFRQRSILNTPLIYKTYQPKQDINIGKVLLLGGIHGDEYSSVSIIFKWIKILNKYHSGLFHWQVVPLLNPDGLLQKKSQRVNSNSVDLNRNFPSHQSAQAHLDYWQKRTYSNSRKYPGKRPLSEPESLWLYQLINDFKPDVIVSVHAPYGIVDFDGDEETNIAPDKLGPLNLHLLGTYPGSLGRYGQTVLNIPVMTIELKSAGIMPSKHQISAIWVDLISWLKKYLKNQKAKHLEKINN